MTTIEIGKESSEITQITDIKDASKVDLGGAKMIVDQVETGGKKGKEEAMQHIKKGETWAVANYLDNYEGLDNEVAIALINNGELGVVKNNLEKFAPLKKDLQIIFIKKGLERNVAENVKLFDLSPNETAHNIIKYGKENYALLMVCQNIEKFNELDDAIAYKILSFNAGDKYEFLAKNLKHFNNLSKETAKTLIEKGYINAVGNNIKQFNKSDLSYITKDMIEKGGIKKVIENIDKFEGIDQVELVKKFIDLGEDIEVLCKNVHKFDEEGKKYLTNYLTEQKYLKDSDGQRKQYKSLDENELFWKKNEITAINQLKKLIGHDNIKFKENTLYPKYFSGELVVSTEKGKHEYKLPITIYHEKGDINNIKINDLNIKIENLEDVEAILKTIIKVLKKVNYEDSVGIGLEFRECVEKNNNIYLKNRRNNPFVIELTRELPIFEKQETNQFPLNDQKTMRELADYINNKRSTSDKYKKLRSVNIKNK